MLLRGQYEVSGDDGLTTVGVVDLSPSSLNGKGDRATGLGERARDCSRLGVSTEAVRRRGRLVCSNLGVRRRVRVLPDELDGREDA